jgi:hypothetical protein
VFPALSNYKMRSLKFGLTSFIVYLMGNTISGQDSQHSVQQIRPETIHYVGRTFRNNPSRRTCSAPELPKKIYYLDTTGVSKSILLYVYYNKAVSDPPAIVEIDINCIFRDRGMTLCIFAERMVWIL